MFGIFSKFGRRLTFGAETNEQPTDLNTTNADMDSATKASKSKSESDQNEDKRKETEIDTEIYNRSSVTLKEKKQKCLKRKKPKPSSIEYIDGTTSESDNSDSESKIEKLRRVRKRPAIRHCDSESSESKKPRSESSESKKPRSESPKSSSTEEEINITESQVVVKKKKSVTENVNNELNRSLKEIGHRSSVSASSVFFSCEDKNKDGEKLNEDVNNIDENLSKTNKEDEKQKVAKKKKCLAICNLIDLIMTKNHPLGKYRQFFTHKALKRFTKEEFHSLNLAAVNLSQSCKK